MSAPLQAAVCSLSAVFGSYSSDIDGSSSNNSSSRSSKQLQQQQAVLQQVAAATAKQHKEAVIRADVSELR
jgi:hypothetical protein